MTAHPDPTSPADESTAVYFGTWRVAGHYAFLPGMRRPEWEKYQTLTPWGGDGLDRAPKWGEGRETRYRGRYGKQGDATLRHKDGWTAIAVADYSVDNRPNSHATFVFKGDLTFDQAAALAREKFPAVADRVGEIREVPDGC